MIETETRIYIGLGSNDNYILVTLITVALCWAA